jgi:hypothetical protein
MASNLDNQINYDLQNQYYKLAIENEKDRREKILKEQGEKNKLNLLAKKKTNDDKVLAEQKEKAQLIRSRLINDYLFKNTVKDDDIDGRMVRQIIRHGNKAKDSITYRVNRNRNINTQAQEDELKEQATKQWWGNGEY